MTCCPDNLDEGAPASTPVSSFLFGLGSTVDVELTTDPVDVIGYTLPANRIASAGRGIRLHFFGDFINNNGVAANASWNVAVRLGGVALWQGNTTIFPPGAGRRTWAVDVWIARKLVTTCALGGYIAVQGSTTTPTGAGLGALTATSQQGGPVDSGATDPVVNWAIAQAVALEIDPSIADAGVTWSARGGYVATID